jgi:hypothetical protein
MLADRIRFAVWLLRDSIRDRVLGKRHRTRVFERIYTKNLWGEPESVSGPGSSRSATETVRGELPQVLERLQVHTLLDAPCGDFRWMTSVAEGLERYVGVDIVPTLVAQNSRAFGTDRISFLCADIASEPLPACDMVLCRDCFIHLPTRIIRMSLDNFRATGARYLLLSNDRSAPYHDIPVGGFRPIDFTAAPFFFPEPLERLAENQSGRELCLWLLQELPLEHRGR